MLGHGRGDDHVIRACDAIAATDHAHGIDGGGHRERRIGREAGERHGGRELDRGPGGAGGSGREPEHGKAAGPKPKTPDVGRRAELPLPRFRPNNTGDPEKPAATPACARPAEPGALAAVDPAAAGATMIGQARRIAKL